MVRPTLSPVLNRFSNECTVAFWNSFIRDAVNQGQTHKAIVLFRRMKQNGLEPNNLTFPFIAKAFGQLSNVQYAQIIHSQVAKSPFLTDVYVQTALVDMYVKCGHADFAYRVFDRMPERDIAAWNAMLVGFGQLGFLDKVSILFKRMRIDGIRPDSVTVIGLTKSVLSTKDLKLLNAVHSFGIRIGIEVDVSVANTWIAAYAKCGNLGSAEMVFDGIDLSSKTIVSWNSLIAGCASFEVSFKAIAFYKRLLYDGFRPDLSTTLNLLSSCVQPDMLCLGRLIHSHGIQIGCDFDVTIANTLISMYSKCGDINSARHIFDCMINKSCVSWTAMIGGYTERGDLDEALTLFHFMEASGEKPDLVTVLYIISGCGKKGALESGKWIESYAISHGLINNVMVCNSLIDMYAKCGNMIDARKVFISMHERTVVTWTTIISGCSLNGESDEALDRFFQMLELGFKPNHVTFLSVLQACTHAGFMEKAWECFNLMTRVYGINPGLDHYSCMVDLLGRRGELEEALELIKFMPFTPDAGIWGSLLSACKIHKNVEIGEYASRQLFELEPQVATPYVEMANIYASAGRWDSVATLRMMMKGHQVTKSPGQSLVQVNGRTHTFSVEDRWHPESSLIYESLDGLALILKVTADSSSLEEIINLERLVNFI